MGCIKDDKAGNNEEKIDATAAVGQRKGDRALGDLESIRCDAEGVKAYDRNGREKPENLDMDEHPASLACAEGGSNKNPGIAPRTPATRKSCRVHVRCFGRAGVALKRAARPNSPARHLLRSGIERPSRRSPRRSFDEIWTDP